MWLSDLLLRQLGGLGEGLPMLGLGEWVKSHSEQMDVIPKTLGTRGCVRTVSRVGPCVHEHVPT